MAHDGPYKGSDEDLSHDRNKQKNNDLVGVPNETQHDGKGKGFIGMIRDWPKVVFCIIGNEFCERFSYYGMRTILIFYLINILRLGHGNAIATYHGFIVVAYMTSIFGSILADSYIGKFSTILYLSILYAAGQITLSLASFLKVGIHPWLDFAGLAMIAIGTGGIKPCVSAFGGEQFQKRQEYLIPMYFAVFYFSINAVQRCFGESSCFPVAFGIPAILMVVSLLIFLAGSFAYRKYPPKENIVLQVLKVTFVAIKNSFSSNKQKRNSWVEHYLDTHDCSHDQKCQEVKGECHKVQLVKDVRALLRIVVMYVPVPMFWALFDQQGSYWTIQAMYMNGRVGGFTILPDWMQVLNSILIMVFIPISQSIVYPLVAKLGINFTPLRKMSVGGLFAAGAFIIAMFVQFAVNKTLPPDIPGNTANLGFVNALPCDISLSTKDITLKPFTIPMHGNMPQTSFKLPSKNASISWQISPIGDSCSGLLTNDSHTQSSLSGGMGYYAVFGNASRDAMMAFQYPSEREKSTKGQGEFKISINILSNTDYNGTKLLLCSLSNLDKCDPISERWYAETMIMGTKTEFVELLPADSWNLFMATGNSSKDLIDMKVKFQMNFQGGIYSLTIFEDTGKWSSIMHNIIPDNSVHMLWQVPQYMMITAGEILFSITGLEFSFTQAPLSMKSVIQAIWLLTVSLGDIIVLVSAEAQLFSNVAYVFLLFAGLMVAVMVVFMLLAIFYYEYAVYSRDDEEDNGGKAAETSFIE